MRIELRRSLSAWNRSLTYSERPEAGAGSREGVPRPVARPRSAAAGVFDKHQNQLAFEVERDCAEYLGESQSLEFSQDGFRGESFVEALDDGIERYASTGQIVAAVALLDEFFCHQANYSGNPFTGTTAAAAPSSS